MARKKVHNAAAAAAAASMSGAGGAASTVEAVDVLSVAPVSRWREKRGAVVMACMQVILVPRAWVRANDYNPNSVPRDKLELLAESIAGNGFCFPIVVIRDEEASAAECHDVYVIIDGFHRWTVLGPEWLDMREVPVVVLAQGMEQRLAATWKFNKARGTHQVDLDAELIRRLVSQGLSDAEVAGRLGVDLDTVHRYRQVGGIAEVFAAVPYSLAWRMEHDGAPADSAG